MAHPSEWGVEEVQQWFLSREPGVARQLLGDGTCEQIAAGLAAEEVDGDALLAYTRTDLKNDLELKAGALNKLMKVIEELRNDAGGTGQLAAEGVADFAALTEMLEQPVPTSAGPEAAEAAEAAEADPAGSSEAAEEAEEAEEEESAAEPEDWKALQSSNLVSGRQGLFSVSESELAEEDEEAEAEERAPRSKLSDKRRLFSVSSPPSASVSDILSLPTDERADWHVSTLSEPSATPVHQNARVWTNPLPYLLQWNSLTASDASSCTSWGPDLIGR